MKVDGRLMILLGFLIGGKGCMFVGIMGSVLLLMVILVNCLGWRLVMCRLMRLF